MSSSAINAQLFQAKIGSIQNQADSTSVYSAGVWSFKNSTALTSVTITDAGAVTLGPSGFTGNHVVNGNVGIGTASKITGLEPFTQFTVSGSNGGIAINSTNTAASDYSRLCFTKQGATGNEGVIRYNTNDYHMGFFTNATERMRIDASGNLLVGATSNVGGYRLVSSISSTTSAILAENNSSSASGVGGFTSGIPQTANNTGCYHFRGVTNNVAIWYLYGNGTSSFTSDQRLKKNVEPARDGYAEDLCKLRVVKYHWNTNEDSEAKELGLIAQEVEQVFPGLVQEADVEFEGGLKPKVLKGSVLPFMLLKAIQEQQAMIKSMKAEIEALKAK